MRRAILVVLGLLCMSKGTAWGYLSYTDGYELQRVCSSNGDAETLACSYYNPSGFDMLSSIGSQSQSILCVGKCWQAGHLQNVVKLWLRDHPDTRHWTAAFIVEKALQEEFPCN